MWGNLQLDEELIDIEMDRIKLVFEKEKYDDDQKKWYLESVIEQAKKSNDIVTLEVCHLLLNQL